VWLNPLFWSAFTKIIGQYIFLANSVTGNFSCFFGTGRRNPYVSDSEASVCEYRLSIEAGKKFRRPFFKKNFLTSMISEPELAGGTGLE